MPIGRELAHGRRAGISASCRACFAISPAWSPMRSSSDATWSSASRKRRSRATGCCVAIVIVIRADDLALRLVDLASAAMTVSPSSASRSTSAWIGGADLRLDQRAHPKDLVLDLALLAIERAPRRGRDVPTPVLASSIALHQPNRPEM